MTIHAMRRSFRLKTPRLPGCAAGRWRPRAWLAACIAFLAIEAAAAAQAPAPPPAPGTLAPAVEAASLTTTRAAFLRQIMAESQLLTEQYERALAKLEGELAAAGEYEEARLVQQRRSELKGLYAAADTNLLTQSLAIPLAPAQARLTGAEVRGELLMGWRTANGAAEWSGVRVPVGRYYIELEANLMEQPTMMTPVPGRAQPTDRAAFEFHEVSLLPGAAENRRGFEISLSSDAAHFTPVRVGPVNFTRSPVTLRLTAMAGYPGNLVSLRNIRLVPAAEEVPAVTAPVVRAGKSLQELREQLDRALNEAQQPWIDRYVQDLDRARATSPETADAVDAEKKRVQKLVDSAQSGGPLRLLTTSNPVVGFEDIEGARFVPDPENRGDRFIVEHEGRRQMVRLLWVLCAPVDDQDPAARKAFAEHFEMAEDHVAGLGRAAQEFTQGYLQDKPLRLLVRPAKDKDGVAAALVFLPELGLYQNVLIDQGLAAVQPPVKPGRRGLMENALLANMIDRERVARRQKPPPGAWAFFGEAGK